MRILRPFLFLSSALVLVLLVCGSAFAHSGSDLVYESVHAVGGDDDDAICDSLDECKKLEDKYEKKIKDLQGKEKSLENEIGGLNSQISLIQAKIATANKTIVQKQEELKDLESDIDVMSGKIEKLAGAVSYQSALFNERVRTRYKSGNVSPLYFIFSENINNLVRKLKFIREVEADDQKLIGLLQDTKKNYEGQKLSLEEKKTKVEEVKAKIEKERAGLETFRADLAKQKSEKDVLLKETQGNELKYQDLLAQARAEISAIEGVVATINFSNGSKIDDGDIIAIMGNSGAPYCSTGAHLHFEVRKNGKVVNAENYVKSKSLYVDDYSSGYKKIGSGKWEWPMKGQKITQRYGKTPWSWRYSGKIHTGIDMVSSNTAIYAPDDGKMIKGKVGCYSTMMNYVAIDHGDGIVSYYFHVK